MTVAEDIGVSDDVHQAIREITVELTGVRERLGAAELAMASVRERTETVEAALRDAGRRFDNFLARFEELMQMLVSADTENLQRVTKLETLLESENATLRQDNAALRQDVTALWQRLEAVERKLAG